MFHIRCLERQSTLYIRFSQSIIKSATPPRNRSRGRLFIELKTEFKNNIIVSQRSEMQAIANNERGQTKCENVCQTMTDSLKKMDFLKDYKEQQYDIKNNYEFKPLQSAKECKRAKNGGCQQIGDTSMIRIFQAKGN